MILKNSSVIEREEKLKQGLAEEETKKNINDSKFRAVAQRMDYPGFHQMVLGANLKPTKAGEMYTITDEKKSIFNSNFRTNKLATSKNLEKEALIVKWRRSDKNARICLLENISNFQSELEKFSDFTILADVISICYEHENIAFVSSVIEMLTHINEFKGSKKLLTRIEKEKLDNVLSRLQNPQITEYLSS